MARTIFDEIDDTSLVQTGVPRLATNYLFRGDNGQAEPHSATIAKRFRALTQSGGKQGQNPALQRSLAFTEVCYPAPVPP